MRGIPLRLEVGPRDLQNGQCVVAKRVNGEKITLPLDEKLPETIAQLLDDIHEEMYQKALAFRKFDFPQDKSNMGGFFRH